ncbi:hypothetical protein SCWH03_41900 [Streptomyces pacificus]|uniref:Uncharacterized protein n=1 Tax=Streptomyces pacificus TaxID=2705029 RepID=A0A6A0AYB9_9ACTN|nr:hypothetical protein SCWH03_41900 [Streptomyces pacificus]
MWEAAGMEAPTRLRPTDARPPSALGTIEHPGASHAPAAARPRTCRTGPRPGAPGPRTTDAAPRPGAPCSYASAAPRPGAGAGPGARTRTPAATAARPRAGSDPETAGTGSGTRAGP